MQQMSLGKSSVLRYLLSAAARQEEVTEFKVQQLTIDHCIERNMAFILNKISFSNSYLLSHRFFHPFICTLLQSYVCEDQDRQYIPSVWPGLLAVTSGARDACYRVLIVSLGYS